MPLIAALLWLLKCVFSCNHLRTPVSEGKCYCPDCGAGVIFRWIVLRCSECRTRRESRYFLRQVVPAERCCPYCGQQAVAVEPLDSPAYYQLAKARLIAQAEADFERDHRMLWTACQLMQATGDSMHRAMADTHRLLAGSLEPKRNALPAAVTIRW